jgi:uncharacterized membrane protein YesL
MILFLIKKTFFDMWDNLLSIVLLNAGFLLVVAGGVYLPSLLSFHWIGALIGLIAAIEMICLYIGAIALMTRDIANYQSPEFNKFFRYLKESWKVSCAFGLVIIAQVLIITFVMNFYLGLKNIVGLAIASLLFWVSLTWWLASQYYFPILGQLDQDLKKIFRKCFVLFFDNTLFTLGLTLGAIVIIVLSSFVVFLLPGVGTLLLWHQVGLKLRLYKYDYLEQHPEARGKPIPWAALLANDRERVGPRTLRGMIFPWKE